MPRYDYYCKPCKIVREVTHSIKEDPEIKCEECKANMYRGIQPGVGFVLKGLNWSGKAGRIGRQKVKEQHGLYRRSYDKSRDTMKEALPNCVDMKSKKVEMFPTWTEAGKFAKEQGFSESQYQEKDKEVAGYLKTIIELLSKKADDKAMFEKLLA